ncbi:MAG: methyltransferase domain-containing protein [Verrucomicrobiales bacterium]|nr:methyltransferase domain-containing protein [Verrucomicrobiales bacterium]
MKKNSSSRWLAHTIGTESYKLLNFDHPTIESLILDEMDTGFDVYYDNRWGLTTNFSNWLAENRHLVANRNIIILGAGAGIETLALAKYGKNIYLNDLSELSLKLCAEQLDINELTNYQLIPGDFTKIAVPPECDLAVACFSIYCQATASGIGKFLDRYDGEVIIVNEYLKAFREFLATTKRKHETLQEWEGGIALRFFSKS